MKTPKLKPDFLYRLIVIEDLLTKSIWLEHLAKTLELHDRTKAIDHQCAILSVSENAIANQSLSERIGRDPAALFVNHHLFIQINHTEVWLPAQGNLS